jgi:Ca-activated chloride channel family protein
MRDGDEAGLHTPEGDALAVLGVQLTGDLQGTLLQARLEQRFGNQTGQNVEAIYSFPLPWGAVLLGLTVSFNDRQFTGSVMPKPLAGARYQQALAEGDAALLLKQVDETRYCVSIGNLAQGETCTITVQFAQTLPYEQQGLRLLVPTVLAPRYGDPLADGGLRPHQVPRHSLTAVYPFDLTLRLHGDLATARVSSPTHSIQTIVSAPPAQVLTVSLAAADVLDRDFVLVLDQLAHGSVALLAADAWEAGKTVMLASFCPQLAPSGAAPAGQVLPMAVKVLVDCSGSMGGQSIDTAREALRGFIGQLGEGDHFSLSRFGSQVEHASQGLWPVNDRTRLSAMQWLQATDANMGGTELNGALDSTFALTAPAGTDVLLLTDAQVYGVERVVATARASGHRIFVVGIGNSADLGVVHRLAESTGGACDFVAPGEGIRAAVMRMHSRMRSARMTGVRLQGLEGIGVQWQSALPGAVFEGDTVHVWAVLDAPPAGPVQLLGRCGDSAQERLMATATITQGTALAPAAADTLVRMAAAVRTQALCHEDPTRHAPRATELALTYQLVSPLTDMVLVLERADHEKPANMPRQHQVPQMMPAGWGGAVRHARTARSRNYFECRVPDYTPSGLAMDWEGLYEPAISSPLQKLQHDARWTAQTGPVAGLTPLGLSVCFRSTPAASWPASAEDLRGWGLGQPVLDWLSDLTRRTGSSLPVVVQVLAQLLSHREVHAALQADAPAVPALEGAQTQLQPMNSALDSQEFARVLSALTQDLQDMHDILWPAAVLAQAQVEVVNP